jgi:hypothetical protein
MGEFEDSGLIRAGHGPKNRRRSNRDVYARFRREEAAQIRRVGRVEGRRTKRERARYSRYAKHSARTDSSTSDCQAKT